MSYFKRSNYEQLPGKDFEDDEYSSDSQQNEQDIRIDHLNNIDQFLTNVYDFYNLGGLHVIILDHILAVIQFVFLFFLVIELTVCTKWNIIMQPDNLVYSWSDVFEPPGKCWSSLSAIPSIFLTVAVFVLIYKVVSSSAKIQKFFHIKKIYTDVLQMPTSSNELANITWTQIQDRLIEIQSKIPLTSQKERMSSLDIYNRILRFDNYLIAMIHDEIIPVKFKLPTIFNIDLGYITFLTSDYEYNLKIFLFKSPFSPFKNYFQLKKEYKWSTKRKELAKNLQDKIFIQGIINLVGMPGILIVRIVNFICTNAERIRFEPHLFVGRRWSRYANYALRHFNELPHQLNSRLSRAYKPAQTYLDCFPSRLISVVATHVGFIAGGTTAALLLMNLICDDFFHLPGFLAIIFAGGLISKACSALIPDEYAVYSPKTALLETLKHIHYLPDEWKENADTYEVRNKFARLCQYKFIAAMEELLSPIITPFIFIFILPNYSLKIVDFLRNYSVDLPGVGDICHLGTLDIALNGDKMWQPDEIDDTNEESKDNLRFDKRNGMDVFNGRTELSLMHFNLMNPNNDLPANSKLYLDAINNMALKDLLVMKNSQHSNFNNQPESANNVPGMFDSLYLENRKISKPSSVGDNLGVMRHLQINDSDFNRSIMMNGQQGSSSNYQGYKPYSSQTEESIYNTRPFMPSQGSTFLQPDNIVNMDMSVSALYIHELHQRKKNRCLINSSRISDNQDQSIHRNFNDSDFYANNNSFYMNRPSTSAVNISQSRQEPGIVRHVIPPSNNRSAAPIEKLTEVDSEAEDGYPTSNLQDIRQSKTNLDSTQGTSPTNLSGIKMIRKDWPDLPPEDS